ncbi:translation initiation factor IF-2 [Strigops habroptila]|uniref:translation initiation factor IF-2 n=1 Tax=Strigops habroptila TaxID=2489341 RepID=UPI0011CF5DE9|nr:translation initiation factor IF-2 [Strigops habroptila]
MEPECAARPGPVSLPPHTPLRSFVSLRAVLPLPTPRVLRPGRSRWRLRRPPAGEDGGRPGGEGERQERCSCPPAGALRGEPARRHLGLVTGRAGERDKMAEGGGALPRRGSGGDAAALPRQWRDMGCGGAGCAPQGLPPWVRGPSGSSECAAGGALLLLYPASPVRVNVEEGKCGSRHLTSFINENYLKLRNK